MSNRDLPLEVQDGFDTLFWLMDSQTRVLDEGVHFEELNSSCCPACGSLFRDHYCHADPPGDIHAR